jgi:hypothetical protein
MNNPLSFSKSQDFSKNFSLSATSPLRHRFSLSEAYSLNHQNNSDLDDVLLEEADEEDNDGYYDDIINEGSSCKNENDRRQNTNSKEIIKIVDYDEKIKKSNPSSDNFSNNQHSEEYTTHNHPIFTPVNLQDSTSSSFQSSDCFDSRCSPIFLAKKPKSLISPSQSFLLSKTFPQEIADSFPTLFPSTLSGNLQSEFTSLPSRAFSSPFSPLSSDESENVVNSLNCTDLSRENNLKLSDNPLKSLSESKNYDTYIRNHTNYSMWKS